MTATDVPSIGDANATEASKASDVEQAVPASLSVPPPSPTEPSVPVIDPNPIKNVIATGLRNLSRLSYADQLRGGYWPKGVAIGPEHNLGSFFADLHSKVSEAYDTYSQERNPRKIIWIDPKTGKRTTPGNGFPEGLAVDLVFILQGLLGFSEALGIDLGAIAADMSVPVGIPLSSVVDGVASAPENPVDHEDTADLELEDFFSGEGDGEDDFDLGEDEDGVGDPFDITPEQE